MAVWDLVRRPLVFLARGLCTCSLALLYLFISLAPCSGGRTLRAALLSDPQESPRKGSTVPSPPSVVEEKSSIILETTLVGPHAPPLDTHHHSCFSGGQPLVASTQGVGHLVIPKIVVQDFSAKDGLVHYKFPEYDLADSLKRRRRFSRARAPMTLEGRLAFTARPPPFRPPTLGAPPVGGLGPLHLTDGLKHRPSDVLAQNLAGFTGRKRTFGDVMAKDGSFVIVGL